jgi:uncharacterized protein YutE (UPF0331/DUF86 family)
MYKESEALLIQNIDTLRDALRWLARSYERCKDIKIDKELTEEDFDAFENLTSRYARTLDILINKVLRTIDIAELEEPGTIIDIINRSEKRGIIPNAYRVRELKDLRNEIVHEYNISDLTELFAETLLAAQDVSMISARAIQYCTDHFKYPGPSMERL